jgi:hypothetical protein
MVWSKIRRRYGVDSRYDLTKFAYVYRECFSCANRTLGFCGRVADRKDIQSHTEKRASERGLGHRDLRGSAGSGVLDTSGPFAYALKLPDNCFLARGKQGLAERKRCSPTVFLSPEIPPTELIVSTPDDISHLPYPDG